MPFISAHGIHLHYLDVGSGAPLLVLGGLGDQSRNWRSVADALSQDARVLLLDHRGAGQSDKPDEAYSITLFADDAAAFLKSLHIEHCAVLGFSMGGMVAQVLAAAHPQLVSKLILVGTVADRAETPKAGQAVEELYAEGAMTETSLARVFDILYGSRFKSRFTPQQFISYRMKEPHPQPAFAYARQLAAVKSFDGRSWLNRITCPTLIIAGKEDPLAPPAAAHDLHARIGGSQLVIYPDVGHMIAVEEPQRFAEDVRKFLAQ